MDPSQSRDRYRRFQRAVPALGVLLALIVGILLVRDYGMSVDEHANAEVGEAALEVYRGDPEAYFSWGEVLAHHGPAYFMAFSISSRLLASIVPGWVAADGRHLTNYLSFLLAAGALFSLCRRWLRPSLAWLTMALFLTQPLLFGYAFVNQKDTPFMAAFVVIVAAGLAVGDRLVKPRTGISPPGISSMRQLRVQEWKALRPAVRVLLLVFFALAVVVILDLWIFGWSSASLRTATIAAHAGRSGPLTAWLFAGVAAHPAEIPLETYLSRLDQTLDLARIPLSLALLAGAALVLRATFPLSSRRWLDTNGKWFEPGFVGAIVGFAVSMRPIGAFAGALVGLYWILRLKRQSFVPLLSLWVAAAVVAYGTWPYLWSDPLRNLWGSLQLTATFPAHDMLYRGVTITSDALPWHFFPTLASIQLTEPVMPLILIGAGALVWRLRRRTLPWQDAAVVGSWVGIPLFGLLVLGFGIYGNIRQLLFILPPLFLMAGLGLDLLLGLLHVDWVRGVVAGAILLPGILGIVCMHPYEHAYFNLYAGGVDGAWGEYQPSHWCTSLREAAEYVNQVAPRGSLVLVDGPVEGVRTFARPDLEVEGVWTQLPNPGFVVTCTRTPEEIQVLPGMVKAFQVGRGQAVYAEVFQAAAP